MNHYFLIIYGGEPKSFLSLCTDYMNAVLTTCEEYEFCLQVADNVAPILRKNSTYISVLNECKGVSNIDDVTWRKIDSSEEIQISDCEFSLSIQTNALSEGNSTGDSSLYLAAGINTLNKQLPQEATYKVDVIVHYNFLKSLPISYGVEVGQALICLCKKYTGCVKLIVDELNDKTAEDWVTFLNAEIITTLNIGHFKTVLWRGFLLGSAISGARPSLCPGFELSLNCSENIKNWSWIKKMCSLKSQSRLCKEVNQSLIILSSELEVMEDCNFSTIPKYMFSPLVFQLRLVQPRYQRSNSGKLLQMLRDNTQLAFMVRLYFCTNENKVPSAFSSNSETVKCPIFTSGNYIMFAITKSQTSSNILAFPLCDSRKLNNNFFKHQMDVLHISPVINENFGKLKKQCLQTLENLPHISACTYYQSLYRLSELKKKLIEEYQSKNLSVKGEESNFDLILLMKYVHELEYENITHIHCAALDAKNDMVLTFEEEDPSDWPERKLLLHKHINEDKNRKGVISEMFTELETSALKGSLLPLLPIENVKKYFKQTGEAVNAVQYQSVITPKHKTVYEKEELDVKMKERWPAVINCVYHDVYYNCNNEAEVKEEFGHQSAIHHVKHQTLSTFWDIESLNNETRTISQSTNQKMVSKLSKFFPKGMRTPDVNPDNISNGNFLSTDSCEKKSKRVQKQMKTRSSPRRKSATQCNPAARNVTARNKQSPEDVERLKRKLREAVANALESHGIGLKHQNFKPCGKKLFAICHTFLEDISHQKGRTSQKLKTIAEAHVKQVIEFYATK